MYTFPVDSQESVKRGAWMDKGQEQAMLPEFLKQLLILEEK